MVLGKLPVPGRPINLDYSRARPSRLKTHFSAYMRRVAFIITSNKHTLPYS